MNHASRSNPFSAGLAVLVALCAGLVVSCGPPEPVTDVEQPRHLQVGSNPFGAGHPQFVAQPNRPRPSDIAVSADGKRAWVPLQGSIDKPGNQVAVLDLDDGTVLDRVTTCSSPSGVALHPDGDLAVTTCRYSNHLAVIATSDHKVLHKPAADFYMVRAAFTPDGGSLWLTNRWRDAVYRWDVDARSDGLHIAKRHKPIAVGTNPRDLAITPNGRTVAVASVTGMTVSLVDAKAHIETHRIAVGAPAADVALDDDRAYVATLSRATHHRAHAGPDTDGDGKPGDGTPNINFQDLQNELAVYRLSDGKELFRYTSDSICCRDYRDVHPADIARGGDLLPPKSTWIVAGALPEQLILAPHAGSKALFVTYAGSNELQRFTVDKATGALTAGPTWPTPGHNPRALALAAGRLAVVHTLAGSVSMLDPGTGKAGKTITLQTAGAPAYPATDVELGELVNHVTAPFSVDGDQTCAHCHRDGGNIDKAFSMPLTRYPGVGLRMTMAYRAAFDTRPWFFESAMDEDNFKPVINEFARIENFCCHDYTLFSGGAPGDCSVDPPAQCTASSPYSPDGVVATRPADMTYAHPRPTPHPSRDRFFKAAAKSLIGRRWSFGDGLYFEDPVTDERLPIALDFDGITRALGLFLMARPRLLPNPNPADTTPAVRGRAIFESAATGCATCHPAPSFAVSSEVNPLGVPIRMPPVVSPLRDDKDRNLDLMAGGFAQAFPKAEQDTCEDVCSKEQCAKDPNSCDHLRRVFLGAPTLRGIWDRARSMLHHGEAQGLREVLCTPGHPALRNGEVGRNERDGVPDTHGGTSHLKPQQIRDLEAYVLSL